MSTGRDFLVYLAGPISGLTYDQGQDWREYAAANLPQEIRAISPLRAKKAELNRVGIIQDAYENHPLTSTTGITSRDKFDCMRADAVLFNMLGAKTVSVGTCMEFGWVSAARANPVIVTVIEDEGNVHDHPMVRGVTGFRVRTLDEGLKILEAILMPEGKGTPRQYCEEQEDQLPGSAILPPLEQCSTALLSGSQNRIQSSMKSIKTRPFSR